MSGEAHFEVYPTHFNPTPYPEGNRNEWRWRLRSANGEIVASGEGFTRREDARRAIVTISQTVVDLALADPSRSAAPGHALDAACLPIIDLDLDGTAVSEPTAPESPE
jgi:uncharacterized protein YegP (UPF0339 family)